MRAKVRPHRVIATSKEQAKKFEDLTPELQEKARNCKNNEELLELAKKEGIQLSDEELQQIAGGGLCAYYKYEIGR